MGEDIKIEGIFYPSFYIHAFDDAVVFYSKIFGEPAANQERLKGWKIGNTWLTVFPSQDGGVNPDANPQNCEFAVRVSRPEEVDLLFDKLVEAGAKPFWEPRDTAMYEPMRFGCVDDPFGIRIDVYCPISGD